MEGRSSSLLSVGEGGWGRWALTQFDSATWLEVEAKRLQILYTDGGSKSQPAFHFRQTGPPT